jgi:hypothetical protein
MGSTRRRSVTTRSRRPLRLRTRLRLPSLALSPQERRIVWSAIVLGVVVWNLVHGGHGGFLVW